MTKDWNDDLKLLSSINAKIKAMKIGKEMSYDLFREKFSSLSLQTKAVGHIADVVMSIKDRLTDVEEKKEPLMREDNRKNVGRRV